MCALSGLGIRCDYLAQCIRVYGVGHSAGEAVTKHWWRPGLGGKCNIRGE